MRPVWIISPFSSKSGVVHYVLYRVLQQWVSSIHNSGAKEFVPQSCCLLYLKFLTVASCCASVF